HGHGVGELEWPLENQPAAAIAEDAAPDLVEADRDDRRRGPLDDLLKAAVERQQEAGAGEAALGEDADDFAPGQGVTGQPQRLDDGSRAGRAVDGDDARPAQEVPEAPAARPAGKDDKMDESSLGKEQKEPVQVADVVANEQGGTGGRHVVAPEDADAVKQVRP